jgi:hypothetical protein
VSAGTRRSPRRGRRAGGVGIDSRRGAAWDGEHDLPARHRREQCRVPATASRSPPLGVTARTEVAALAREREQVFVRAGLTADAGDAMLEHAAGEELQGAELMLNWNALAQESLLPIAPLEWCRSTRSQHAAHYGGPTDSRVSPLARIQRRHKQRSRSDRGPIFEPLRDPAVFAMVDLQRPSRRNAA